MHLGIGGLSEVGPIQDSDPDPCNSQPLALKLDNQTLGMSWEDPGCKGHPPHHEQVGKMRPRAGSPPAKVA